LRLNSQRGVSRWHSNWNPPIRIEDLAFPDKKESYPRSH
jgi:hypothetical protein